LLESRDTGRDLSAIQSFLETNVADEVPLDPLGKTFQPRDDFIKDVLAGVPGVNMMVRITYVCYQRV
jgi:hypothetical protein